MNLEVLNGAKKELEDRQSVRYRARYRYQTNFLLLFILLMSSLHARLYHIHIPKTGGSSMRTLIESRVHVSEIYPRRMPPREMGRGDDPLHHEIVSGHLPLWFCERIDDHFDDAYKFTILREPIDRYLSFLRYRKRNNPSFRSLEHTLKVMKLTDERSNFLCKFLASDPDLSGDALLQSAKENIHRFDFIVFFDRYREDVQKLCDRIGIEWEEEPILHLNTTNPEPVSDALMAEVVRLNELDIALYEYAKRHYSNKDTTYRFASPFYAEMMRKTARIDFTFHKPHKGAYWCYREKVNQFSLDQPIYRYVMDQPAQIFFNLEQRQNYILKFTAQPVSPDISPRVKIGGVEIPIVKIKDAPFATYQGFIPSELIMQDLTEFVFFSSKAYQHNHLYPNSGDNRKLSYAIEKIKITPI